jgi:hypothetical protein
MDYASAADRARRECIVIISATSEGTAMTCKRCCRALAPDLSDSKDDYCLDCIRKLKEERRNRTIGTVFFASVATVILYGAYSCTHSTGSQRPKEIEPTEQSGSTQEIVPDDMAREVYSMQVEQTLRNAGDNVRVEAIGNSHDTLQVKAGFELDDQGANSIMNGIFSNESLITNLKACGFKNVELDSAPSKEAWRGYDTWTRPLPPIQNSPESRIAHPQNGDAQMSSLSPPPNSGHRYHALDLLRIRPFPDQGQLVLLNVIAQPSPLYGDAVSYTTLHLNIPEVANVRGVRFKRLLNNRLCIYDVIESLPNEENVDEPTTIGQIAVELNSGISPPGYENNWEVEPDGFQEVTMTDGTVLHLPKVRFWSYE